MSITFYPNYIHTAGFSKTAEPSITGETYTCSGAETSGAAYDLVDNRRTSLVTIDTSGESTQPIIDFDLSANIVNPDFAIIDNQNLKTADAQIWMEYGAGTLHHLTAAYSGILGIELTAVTLSAGHYMDMGDDGIDGVLLIELADLQTQSAFNFQFNDFGNDNYDADITIGEVAIGVSFSPTMSPDVPQPESIAYGNSVIQSRGGQKNAVQFHGKRRRWTLGWKIIDETNMTDLKAVWDACNGSLYPFWIDLGEGSSNPLLYYVRFAGEFNSRKLTHQAYSLTLTIEEEL